MRSRRFLLPMLVCLVAFARPDGEGPRRVAVLDVGGKEKVSTVLTALLEARLLEEEGRVTLLERAKVERLLEEQALGLSNRGEFDRVSAVRAGEVWGVDVFCLLTRQRAALRLQLVDTWYGIRLMDVEIPLPGNMEMEASAEMLARKIVTQVAKVDADPERMRLVGVMRFKSLDHTRRLSDFEESLRVSVERQLVRWPGVILAEREQVRPLTDERKLVESFPERLRSSLLFLDGEFELDPQDPDRLRIYVRGRREEESVFVRELAVPDWDVARAGARIVETLADLLEGLPDIGEMDPELEAEMLMRQSFSDPKARLGAAAAARALMPDDETYEFAYWERRFGLRKKLPFSLREFEELLIRLETWHVVWAAEENPEEGWRQARSWINRCLDLRDDMRELPADVLQHVNGKCMALYLQHRDRLLDARTFPSSGRPINPPGLSIPKRIGGMQAEHWFRIRAELVKGGSVSGFGRGVSWPDSLSEKEKFDWSLKFYRWLWAREHPQARETALQGLAATYTSFPDHVGGEQTRKFYEAYEASFLEKVLSDETGDPRTRHAQGSDFLSDQIFRFLRSSDRHRQAVVFFDDEQKNIEYRADRTLHILRQVLAHPEEPQVVDWIGRSDAQNLQVLKEAGRYGEVVEILTRAIQYVEEFEELHPGESLRLLKRNYRDLLSDFYIAHSDELRGNLPRANPEYKGEKIWKRSEFTKGFPGSTHDDLGELHARSLVLEQGMAAVIARQGVLFLDVDSLEPLRFETAPADCALRSHYAVDDTGIYTVSRGGIVYFPKQGEPRLFFQHHPWLREGLHNVEVLNRRVYLLAGGQSSAHHASRLLEFDLDRNVAKRLLTSGSTIKKQVVDRITAIYSVVAEPAKNRIHVTVEHRDPEGYQPFVYDPDSGIYTLSRDLRLFRWEYGRAFRRGQEVVNLGYSGYDVRDWGDGYRRLAVFPPLDDHSLPRKYRFGSYRRVARVGKGLVALHMFSGKLDYYPDEYSEKESITYDVFPFSEGPPPRILDIATHPTRGLTVLTRDGLHAVPTLTHDREVAE